MYKNRLLLYDKKETSEECSGGQFGISLKYDRHYYSSCQVCVTAHTIGWLMKNCQLPYPNYGHISLASPSPYCFNQSAAQRLDVLMVYQGSMYLPFLRVNCLTI